MFEREAKRERILEAVSREKRSFKLYFLILAILIHQSISYCAVLYCTVLCITLATVVSISGVKIQLICR
jgi:hypothetical protein